MAEIKPRSKKYVATGLALLTLGGVVLGYVVHFRPKSAVSRYKQELLAKGEKLTVEEMLSPPVPPSQNNRRTFQTAIQSIGRTPSLLDSNPPVPMRMVAPGKALAGWQQSCFFDIHARTPPTNDWAQLAAALADEHETLSLLHTLIEKPTVNLELNYGDGFALMLPHLAQAKRAAQHLQSALLLALRQRETAEVVQHLRAMLALVKASRDERLVISQLVRMAIANLAFGATWSVLQMGDLTETQLAALQQDWLELDFATGMENALAMERAMAEMTLERMRRSSAEFKRASSGWLGRAGGTRARSDDWMEEAGLLLSDGWQAANRKARESAWQASWSHKDELTTLKGYQIMLDAIRLAKSNWNFRAAVNVQRTEMARLGITNKADDRSILGRDEPDLRTMFSDSIISLSRTVDRTMSAEANRQLVMTSIACHRFALHRERYPETLAELVPEFLTQISRDPVDGMPLRYRLVATNQFVLYSVGADGEDGSGDAANPKETGSFSWMQGRDWVWPQPASPEEVKAYYESETTKVRR